MPLVDMLEAKSSLSRLVQAIEDGVESEIIIARNGRPAARLVPMGERTTRPRLGVAKDRFEIPASIDEHNDEVAHLFTGRQLP